MFPHPTRCHSLLRLWSPSGVLVLRVLLRHNLINHVNIQALIPLLLDMKCANTVKLPLVCKQDILEPLPHPLTGTLMPNGDINVLDLINAN
jgi:hypothetical protein